MSAHQPITAHPETWWDRIEAARANPALRETMLDDLEADLRHCGERELANAVAYFNEEGDPSDIDAWYDGEPDELDQHYTYVERVSPAVFGGLGA